MRLFEIDSAHMYNADDLSKLIESLQSDSLKNYQLIESSKNLVIRKTDLFDETLQKYSDHEDKLKDFLRAKEQNPIEPYGKSDTAFIAAGPIGRTGLKLKHAHLSQNISVVYRLHGSNPHIIDLYALMSHKDLGTSNTSNIKQQKKVSKKFLNQDPK